MRIDGFGQIGGIGPAHRDGGRAEASRLIALAIARRSEEADGWTRVADAISAVRPDLATLLRFVRREPPLLAAYFADAARVRRLIRQCRSAERIVAVYAHGLATAVDAFSAHASIVGATDDERLRVRLYELALIAGAPGPTTIAAAAESLGLQTQEGNAALAFLLLRMGLASAHRLPLQAIAGWPEPRRRVFFWRFLALMFQRRLTPFADPAQTFRLALDFQERRRVLRLQMPGQFAAARRSGLQLLCQTVQRAAVSPTLWFDLSLTLPRLATLTTFESWTEVVQTTLGPEEAHDYLTRPHTIGRMTRRFGANGVLHLYPHYGVRSLFEQNLENGARSSKKILKDFASRYPQILPPQALATVEAFTGDRDTFINLVNEYLLGRAPGAQADIAAIVAAAFEIPTQAARALVERETGRRLMAALSQFKTAHDINLLRSVAFDAGAPGAPAGLDGYLYELRNAFALELAIHVARRDGRLIGKLARRRLFDRFFLLEFGVDRLTPERIAAARDRLHAQAVGRINALLEAQGGDQRLEAQDMDALARDWRDAEPVVTLLARLSDPARRGGAGVHAARLVLCATKAAARRRFDAFKFDDVCARRQLAFLSEAQRAAWRTPRALVRTGGGGRPDNQPRLEQLTRQLDADLALLCASAPVDAAQLAPALRAEIAELATEEIKADPAIVVQRVLAAHASPQSIGVCARACLVEIAAQLGGAVVGGFEQRNAARIMRALVRAGFAGQDDSDARQRVLADLRAIEREIPRDLLDGETISQGIVATAFDCSPRLMLTIGDVVNTGCCLNYQSGGRINVLPAYLVDANIQALVSWQLKQAHFASARDYKAALNALVAGRPVGAAFDGDRLRFRFTLRAGDDDTIIDTTSLGFAHLRQIVRLGRAREGFSLRPGLLAEREYAQPHPLQPVMHANHADMLRMLAADLRAVDRRALKFPQSRNPDGVYCDALGGVRLYEYTVYMK